MEQYWRQYGVLNDQTSMRIMNSIYVVHYIEKIVLYQSQTRLFPHNKPFGFLNCERNFKSFGHFK